MPVSFRALPGQRHISRVPGPVDLELDDSERECLKDHAGSLHRAGRTNQVQYIAPPNEKQR